MKTINSVSELISLLKVFPLKGDSLNGQSTLQESIALFGSLMLQRVRSLLLEYYPNSDLRGLTENSRLEEILPLLNKNNELGSKVVSASEKLNHKAGESCSSEDHRVMAFKSIKGEVVSVGIDIESMQAFPLDVMLPSGASFRSKTFCPREIAYASTKDSPIPTLLGIFCAKEAVIKCCPDMHSLTFRDIEITYDSKGAPVCKVRGCASFDFKVSISHSSDYACAFAMMIYSCS